MTPHFDRTVFVSHNQSVLVHNAGNITIQLTTPQNSLQNTKRLQNLTARFSTNPSYSLPRLRRLLGASTLPFLPDHPHGSESLLPDRACMFSAAWSVHIDKTRSRRGCGDSWVIRFCLSSLTMHMATCLRSLSSLTMHTSDMIAESLLPDHAPSCMVKG
jgi:hypothetical protein